jgi:hypothetical protein
MLSGHDEILVAPLVILPRYLSGPPLGMLFGLLTQQQFVTIFATLTGAATVADKTYFDVVSNLEVGERSSYLATRPAISWPRTRGLGNRSPFAAYLMNVRMADTAVHNLDLSVVIHECGARTPTESNNARRFRSIAFSKASSARISLSKKFRVHPIVLRAETAAAVFKKSGCDGEV